MLDPVWFPILGLFGSVLIHFGIPGPDFIIVNQVFSGILFWVLWGSLEAPKWFPKQCLHYGVLAFSRAGEGMPPARGSRTRKIIKKRTVFKLFQTK